MDDDNDRLEFALRAVTKARLLAMQVPAYAVGAWCAAWETEADKRGLAPSAASWEEGIRWIVARIAAGERPPTR
jgi:hypothetical protein